VGSKCQSINKVGRLSQVELLSKET